jgi:hypothetical protein
VLMRFDQAILMFQALCILSMVLVLGCIDCTREARDHTVMHVSLLQQIEGGRETTFILLFRHRSHAFDGIPLYTIDSKVGRRCDSLMCNYG